MSHQRYIRNKRRTWPTWCLIWDRWGSTQYDSAVDILLFVLRAPISPSRVYLVHETLHMSQNNSLGSHEYSHFQIGILLTKISTPIVWAVKIVTDLPDVTPSSQSHIAPDGTFEIIYLCDSSPIVSLKLSLSTSRPTTVESDRWSPWGSSFVSIRSLDH